MTCGSIIHSIWTSSFEKYSFFDTASYLRSWLHYIMYQLFFLAIIFCIFCISQFKYLLHTVNLLIQFLLYRCSGPYLWFFVYWTPLFLFPISFFVFCQIGYAFSNDWKICEEPVFSLHSFINIKPIVFRMNYSPKHNTDAKFGWYRYDTRFAIPVYDDAGELTRYNVFKSRILVRHAKDIKLYLYDILRTKKETSKPLAQ